MIRLPKLGQIVRKFSRSVKIIRPMGAYDEHGRWQSHGEQSALITAHIQTATDKELVNIDEGRRARGGIIVFTIDELRVANVETGEQPDIIPWQGSTFEVQSVENWNEVAGFYRATATRMGQ